MGRGLSNTNVGWYRWMTEWDNGDQWDTVTQGPIPTVAEIAAVTPAQILAAEDALLKEKALRLADDIIARSVARITWEELRKYTLRNNQVALTWDEFRDAIKAEIENRLRGGA